jgi:hypothetical protein
MVEESSDQPGFELTPPSSITGFWSAPSVFILKMAHLLGPVLRNQAMIPVPDTSLVSGEYRDRNRACGHL